MVVLVAFSGTVMQSVGL